MPKRFPPRVRAYDGAGNLSATPSSSAFTYNDAGQWTAEGSESFAYAGSSQDQVLSDGSATGITYGIAGQDGQPWVQSYTPTGYAADYVLRDQQGNPLGYVQGGASYALATDNLGSVTSVISAAGTTVASYTYDPYGHGNAPTGADAADNLIRYTGALQDTSSNYTHLGDRWYNPVTDNFTTQDANSYLASPANGNRYAYAADNPANNTDPTGECYIVTCLGVEADFIVGGAVTGAAIGEPRPASEEAKCSIQKNAQLQLVLVRHSAVHGVVSSVAPRGIQNSTARCGSYASGGLRLRSISKLPIAPGRDNGQISSSRSPFMSASTERRR